MPYKVELVVRHNFEGGQVVRTKTRIYYFYREAQQQADYWRAKWDREWGADTDYDAVFVNHFRV